MSSTCTKFVCSIALLIIAWGCGDDASFADASMGFGDPTGEETNGPAAGARDDNQGSAAEPGLDAGRSADVFVPEEPEPEAPELGAPTASRRYVFIANRSLDSVAKIDSETLAVTPIRVGREPTIVRTVPNGDIAVVLNVGSDSVSIIEARPDEDLVSDVDVIRGCNQIIVSPTGSHAIAWYDNASARAGDEIGSLQEISLVALDGPDAYEVSVGFNIRGVQFDGAGERAYVVTDSGINVLELARIRADVAVPSVVFGDDPLVADIDREVRISGGGSYAVLRSSSHAGVRVVDLATEDAVSVELPAIPTDIDILGDDRTALVALRDIDRIALLRLGDVVDDPTDFELLSIETSPAGILTLTADESAVITYTTLGDDPRLGVLTLDGELSERTIWLEKGIRSVLAAPLASAALVLHSSAPGLPVPGEAVDAFVDKAEAVSLVDLPSGYAKLVLLPVEPEEVVFTPDGAAAFLMLADAGRGVREIRSLDLESFATRTFEMDGLPEAIGVVPGTNRVFVAQESDTGRITFIDAETGDVHHVTAFQLNAFID